MLEEQPPTNPIAQPEKSTDVTPKDAAEVKRQARLKSIDSYRKKKAAHPDHDVAQLGQSNADVLEIEAMLGDDILTELRSRRYTIYIVKPIGAFIALVRLSAQLVKLERELCDNPAVSQTDPAQGDPPSE